MGNQISKLATVKCAWYNHYELEEQIFEVGNTLYFSCLLTNLLLQNSLLYNE